MEFVDYIQPLDDVAENGEALAVLALHAVAGADEDLGGAGVGSDHCEAKGSALVGRFFGIGKDVIGPGL